MYSRGTGPNRSPRARTVQLHWKLGLFLLPAGAHLPVRLHGAGLEYVGAGRGVVARHQLPS